eukprot:s4235_g11.t1
MPPVVLPLRHEAGAQLGQDAFIADYVSAMFDCDIPIPPGGDAAAGTGSACSDHISILANQPGSPSTAAPPATAPAPTPPKVRRCASPPTQTSARTPCNPRVGGPAAAMASPASPRTTSGGYPSSARTGTRPARAPASPPASSSKMESSPPSARRATPGTSSSSSGHNHAAVAAAVANKVAAATQAGSKPSVRPASAASAKVSPNMSARTTMTRPGSLAKSSNSGSLMHRILAKDPSPPVRRTTPTTAPHVPHTSSGTWRLHSFKNFCRRETTLHVISAACYIRQFGSPAPWPPWPWHAMAAAAAAAAGRGGVAALGGLTLRDGALRPPISSRLAALGECADVRCGTHRLAHPEVRPAFLAFAMEQCKAAKLHSEVTALAIGSGGLLFEWEVLEALRTS